MCGGGGDYSTPKEKTQLWKTSKDAKHVSFYAHTACRGATEWCKAHCYMRTKPPKKKFNPDKMELEYSVRFFESKKAIKAHPFCDDFSKAEYITFFASGTLSQFYSFEASEYKIIKMISSAHKDKIIRFFTRYKIDQVGLEKVVKLPKNAVVVLSVDCQTDVNTINWGIESEVVSMISIIDHPDNIMQIDYLRSKIDSIVTCQDCQENAYLCFNQKQQKSLLLMKYISD